MSPEIACTSLLRLLATPNLAAWRGAHFLRRARAMIGAELRAADCTPRAGGTSRQTHPESLAAASHRAVLTPRAPARRRPELRRPQGGSVLVSRGGSILASGEGVARRWPTRRVSLWPAASWGRSGCANV